MADRTLRVEIVGDASSLQKTFGQAGSKADSFGKSLGRVGKYAGLALGGAALGGIAVTLKAGISEWTESAKVAAQTGAVLKSTGGEAGVTAKQIDALAGSIQRKSGMDDEAIQSGENLLLTFTNIRNEAGKGNDIFNQTTQIMADMSTALGQDVKSSAIQLGKALNDPVKGVTALQRVGVSFTAGQKATIKSLVDSGRQMDAQKLILGELNKEFGGSAAAAGKTLPGQLNILKGSFENLAGTLVGKAAPSLTKFVGFLNEKGVPAIGQAFGKISEVAGPALSSLFDTFKKAIPVILGVLGPLVQTIGEKLIPIFQSLLEVGGKAISAIGDVIRANGPQLQLIFENLGTVISNLAKIVLPILEIAFTKILPAALRVLIPALVITTGALAKVSDVARVVAQVLTAILKPVIAALVPVVTAVANAFTTAWGKVSAAVQAAWRLVKPIIDGIVQVIKGMVNIVVGILTGDWARAWSGLKQAAMGGWNVLKAWLLGLPAVVYGWAVQIGEKIIRGIGDGISGLVGWLLGQAGNVVGQVKDKLEFWHSPPEAYGKDLGERLVGGIGEGIKSKTSEVAKKAADMVEAAKSAVEAAASDFGSAFDGLASAADAAFDKITSNFQTKTEKLIAKQDEARAKAERQAALSTAQSGLATAMAGGDPEEIKAAQQAVTDAILAINRARDEKIAAQERKQYEASRERQRVNFDKQLATLEGQLERGQISVREFRRKALEIFDKFDVPFRNAGQAVGAALAAGLRDSFGEAVSAARDLIDAIARELKKTKFLVTVQTQGGGDRTPGRQHGGYVRRGMSYVVGERRPEVFVPTQSGRIIPSMAGGGDASAEIHTHVYLDSTQIAEVVRREYLRFEKRNGRSAV